MKFQMSEVKENSVGKEFTFLHWWFFYRWRGRHPSSVLDKYWKSFAPVLEESVKQAGGWARSSVPKRFEHLESRMASIRLACISGENTETNKAWSLESRTMQDTYYLQTGWSKRGDNSLTGIKKLKAEETGRNPKKLGDTFLGEAVCLWLEVEKLTAANAESLSKELLKAWSPGKAWQVEVVELDLGFLVLPETRQAICILLVWQNDEANNKASYLVHWLLPQIWTALLKKPILEAGFEKIRPEINKLEIELQTKVNQTQLNPRNIQSLEQTIETLSDLKVELANYLGEGEEYLHTLQVNIENVETLLKDKIWNYAEQQLRPLILSPLQQIAEQFLTDIRYAQIEQARAEQVLQGVTTLVQIQSAKWERWLAISFGLLALFGAAEMFPEIVGKNDGEGIPWYLRLTIILFLAVAVFVTNWLWQRRAKKNRKAKLAPAQAKRLKPQGAQTDISQLNKSKGRGRNDEH